MTKRMLAAALVLLAAFLLAVGVSADGPAHAADVAEALITAELAVSAEPAEVRAYAVPGYSLTDKAMLAPFADKATAAVASKNAKSVSILSENWTAEGLVYRTRRRTQSGVVSAYAVIGDPVYAPSDVPEAESAASPEPVNATTMTFDFSADKLSLYPYSALQFGVQIEGDGVYRAELEMTTLMGSETAELLIPGSTEGGWSLVVLDASEAGGRLMSLRITVHYDGQPLPATLSAAQPYAVTKLPDGFANIGRYASDRFDAAWGDISMKTGVIHPDEDGRVYLSGALNTEEELRIGAEGYFEITLDGVTSGNMMLGVLYAGSDEEQRVYGKKVSLNASDGVYTIPVEVSDTIYSYSLLFDNVQCDGAFRLESVRVYSGGAKPASGNPWLGSVSSIVRQGNEIKFSGVMEREAVAQYAGQKLHFFALPGWQADDLTAAVEIGSVKVTTLFEYTADLSQAAASGDTDLFFAAILDEEGEILPLSRPRYADAASAETESASVMGLYGAAPVGAFEAGVPQVLVDVPLDKLLGVSSGKSQSRGTGVSVTFTVYAGEETRTEKLELNHALLTELDRELEFYRSAGIRVYLRLICPTPVEGLTYGGEGLENYAVDLSEPENRYRYAAVVRFLAGRYPRTAGFVLGTGVNDSRRIGETDLSDAAEYAAELADLCRITYNAASQYAGNVSVAVPFVREKADGKERVQLSDRTLAVMLANRLRDVGALPWTCLYCTDDTGDPLTSPAALTKLLSDLELAGPSSSMVFCEVQKSDLAAQFRADTERRTAEGEQTLAYREYVAEIFGSFWERCRGSRARAAFLSVSGTSLINDRDFYAILKTSVETGGAVYESRAKFPEDVSEEDWAGSYTVWDFSDKHYPMDWIAGGGAVSCVTDYSGLFSGTDGWQRVLRTAFEVQSGGCAGMTLCNLKNTVDLTAADAMDVTFALTRKGEDGEEEVGDVTVVFVLGTREVRAEYYADSLRCGEIYTLTCDLSSCGYRAAADYIGVMVYADSGVELELSSVTVKSRTAGDDALRQLFEPEETAETGEVDYLLLGTLCLMFAALSVGVFAVLNRREREEEELRLAQEAERLKTGRRRT